VQLHGEATPDNERVILGSIQGTRCASFCLQKMNHQHQRNGDDDEEATMFKRSQ
jgi:hypothetical protein